MSGLALQVEEPAVNLLKKAYAGFNAREMDAVLALMQPNVEWANGMEGGTVLGHSGVRAYWTRQWAMIDPHVEPVKFEADGAGRLVVSVHQVVRNLDGSVLQDRTVEHLYSLEDGLIRCMEIRE